MCGRFAFYSPAEATVALFGVSGSLDVEPRYNIAPTQYVAAVRNGDDAAGDNQSRELVMLRWGLVPFWAKDPAIGNRMINARAETVAEKPAFRAAYRRRRCIVLADGFYEWHREGSVKVPYYISLASEEPFAFAGLWEHWQDKESDESLQTAALKLSPAGVGLRIALTVSMAALAAEAALEAPRAAMTVASCCLVQRTSLSWARKAPRRSTAYSAWPCALTACKPKTLRRLKKTPPQPQPAPMVPASGALGLHGTRSAAAV